MVEKLVGRVLTKSPMAPQLGFLFLPGREGAGWALSIVQPWVPAPPKIRPISSAARDHSLETFFEGGGKDRYGRVLVIGAQKKI